VFRSPFADVEIPDQTLTDHVLARARELGDRPALIEAATGRTITYEGLIGAVEALAAGLADLGFGKGDVFAHYAPNVPEYAIAFHGVASVGGINTTANPMLTADELAQQLTDSGARLLVTVPALLDKGLAAAQRAGIEEVFVYGVAPSASWSF
jgi:acyl-CoA synthetase (AMP-forming)/AMP-acid ligase II